MSKYQRAPEAESDQLDTGTAVKRGKLAPEQRAEYVSREAERRGLSDEEREAWIAAGGHTSWLHRPTWGPEDEDDFG
jgi:hypothetical protein